MAEQWITTKEAALLAGYTRNHIARLLKEGRVEGRKFGPLWQVNRDSLLAYLDAQRAKGERRRLVKAYREGVLTLDDLAADKTDIERTIAQYTKANEELCADVDGKVPSEVEFENIEEYAAELVMGAEKGLENLKGQHKLYQKLHLRGVLCYEDGEFFMDVSCILGRQRLSTSSNLPSRVRKGGSYAATGVPKLFYMDGEGGQQQEIAD